MSTVTAKFEDRIFYALLVLLVWLPLPMGSNRPWAEAIFEVVASLLVWFWLLGYRRNQVEPGAGFRRARWVVYVLLVWLGYLAFQLIPLPGAVRTLLSPENVAMYAASGVGNWAPLSLHPYATFLFWLKSVAYVMVFALTLLLVNDKYRMVLVGYALLFSAAFQALYGSMMTLSGLEYGFFFEKVAYIGYATGTFVNRNHLAGYLEMASAVGIGLLMATESGRGASRSWRQRARNLVKLMLSQKLLLRLTLAIMVIALVLTRSRMGNTAFFSSLLVAGVLMLLIYRSQAGSVKKLFQRSDSRSVTILISSLVVIDLLIVGAWFGVDKLADRMAQTSIEHDAGRVEVSLNSLNLLKDYPLVGTGGGTFHVAYSRYRGDGITQYYDHAHEDYLEITGDTGVIGIGLLGLVVAMSFGAAMKALYSRRDRLMRGMAFAAVMGIVALLIHSTVDFNLQIPANSATFMVVLALGWIALCLGRQEEQAVVDHIGQVGNEREQ